MRITFTLVLLLFLTEGYTQNSSKVTSFSHDIMEWDSSAGVYFTKEHFSTRTTLELDLPGMKVRIISPSKTEEQEVIKETREGNNLVIFTTYKGLNYKWSIPTNNSNVVVMYYNKDLNGEYSNMITYYY